MSLFIGGLAFEHVGGNAESYILTHRIGILTGSLVAGIVGYLILKMARPASFNDQANGASRADSAMEGRHS
jgi:Na+/H+ antiporter NhaA